MDRYFPGAKKKAERKSRKDEAQCNARERKQDKADAFRYAPIRCRGPFSISSADAIAQNQEIALARRPMIQARDNQAKTMPSKPMLGTMTIGG